ncbi:hypothetical protein Hanom_Chr15g01353401 [Helianthus anomalus]
MLCHINIESSDIIVNREYLTFTLILPPSTHNFAPVTTQYPGGSSGPLTISRVSTNDDIFGVRKGGPSGYIAEFNSTFTGFGSGVVSPILNGVLINVDISPDFRECMDGPSHSDRRIFADATIEYPNRRKRVFFKPRPLTSNQALVTMKAESSMRVSVYSTGRVQTWENMLHLTGSR